MTGSQFRTLSCESTKALSCLPLPQSIVSCLPSLAWIVSLPGPPFRTSRPEPPVSVSSPLPPFSLSLPEPPDSLSFPFPPSRQSAPARPKSWSPPPSPRSRSPLDVPLSVSGPEVPTLRLAQGPERGRTFVVVVALLFAGLESTFASAAVTVFETVPVRSVCTRKVTTARPPTGMLPRLQTSVWASAQGGPWLELLVPCVSDDGRWSLTMTLCA